MKDIIGRVHSTESLGAVDGPGIRFVIFLQGCPLRCLYCHNPDTWLSSDGKDMHSSEIIEHISTYKNFINKGGVTLSGGEPLAQPEFCEAIIEGCHENGFHVAIDTSGVIPLEKSKKAIELADMILLDIKDIDPLDCEALTGMTNENCLKTLGFCEEIEKPVWLRHDLLSDYTLNEEKLNKLGKFLSHFSCIKKVEILPYHTMGLYKWEALGLTSKLLGKIPPSEKEVEWAVNILKKYDLPI